VFVFWKVFRFDFKWFNGVPSVGIAKVQLASGVFQTQVSWRVPVGFLWGGLRLVMGVIWRLERSLRAVSGLARQRWGGRQGRFKHRFRGEFPSGFLGRNQSVFWGGGFV